MANVFYLCDDCGHAGLNFGPQHALECTICKGKAVDIDREIHDEGLENYEDDED